MPDRSVPVLGAGRAGVRGRRTSWRLRCNRQGQFKGSCCPKLVHGWDSIKHVKFYSLLVLSFLFLIGFKYPWKCKMLPNYDKESSWVSCPKLEDLRTKLIYNGVSPRRGSTLEKCLAHEVRFQDEVLKPKMWKDEADAWNASLRVFKWLHSHMWSSPFL